MFNHRKWCAVTLSLLGLMMMMASPSQASNAYERYVTTVRNFVDDYPNGRSNLLHNIYIIWNDGNSRYDFYANKTIAETVPGKVLTGNQWYTVDAKPAIEYCNGSVFLDTTFEKTIYGPTSITETLGFQATAEKGGVGGSAQYQYSTTSRIPDVSVSYQGDLSVNRTKWWLRFNGDDKWNTFQYKPSTNIRVPQNGRLYFASYNYARFNHWFYPQRTLENSFCTWVDKPLS